MSLRFRSLAAALFALTLSHATASYAVEPAIADSAAAQMGALKNLSLQRDSVDRKLDSRLYFALLASNRDTRMTQFPDLRFARAEADGRLPVELIIQSASSLKPVAEQIQALGGAVVHLHHGYRVITARIGVEDLRPLASMSEVKRIRQHIPGQTAGMNPRPPQEGVKVPRGVANLAKALNAPNSVNTSEGDATHGAVVARALYGTDGSGVKICVMSDGVDSLAAAQGSGDLPIVDVLPGQAGSGDEGTAMLEIVHDLAPGADLGFATAATSEASFAQNILDLATDGCNIIVDDIIYLDESPFQDGPVAQSVNTVTAAGVLYFSSAGNEGNKNDTTSGTWEGDFVANGTPAVLAGAGPVHNFGDGGQSIQVEVGGGNPPLLIWAEHYDLSTGTASTDFDLYVLNAALTTVFDASTDVQDGTGGDDFPIEFVSGGTFANERLAVARFAAGSTSSVPMFNLIVFRGELAGTLTTSGTTRGHSAAVEAFSVAATPAATPFAAPTPTGPFPGLFTAANALETFSADGPRRIILSPTGAELTPGNRTSTGGVVRQKPDITAADGVSTSAPGFNPFYGTSAAAPHAAAIAGLIKSAVPAITPAQVRTALLSTAIDIEGPGVDRDSGAGIIMAVPALAAAGGTPQATLSAGAAVLSQIAGDSDGSIEPNEDFSLVIPLTNAGGAAASAITATLSSSTPGVSVYQANSAYPNLAVAASAPNATPYVFNVGAGVPCGTTLSFTLAVSYTGGNSPQNFNFTFGSGSAGAPVTLSYAGTPVAIPDAADLTGNNPGAPADATLVSAVAGSVFDVDLRIDGATCNATAGSTTVGINHSFVNDLELSLVAPNGSVVKTIDNADGSGNNYCQTLLSDEVVTNIQSIVTANAPFTGNFAPANALSGLDAGAATGTWTLRAQDFFSGDTGSIRAWSIILTPAICDAPVQPANLSATKTVAGSFIEGGAITYTVVLTNTGSGIQPDNAGNEFTDTLPAGLTVGTPSASSGTVSAGGANPVTWNGLLLPGASVTITIPATINAGTAGSVISNQGTGSFDANRDGTNEASVLTDDPAVAGSANPTNFTVVAIADLSLALTDAPDPVNAGATLTYTATVSNAGPSPASNVTVTLPTPANTSFVSGSVAGGGSCAAGANIVCTLTGALPAASARVVTINVLVSAAAPGGSSISATATAATTDTDPNLGNNSATVTTAVSTSANLAIVLSASATNVVIGQPVVYTATSTNLGPSDAVDVVVSITLSPDFRFSSLDGGAGAVCTAPQVGLSGVISCTYAGTTAVNAVRTLAVTAYSNSPGTSSVQASTSSPTSDPVSANNTASTSVTVGAPSEPIPTLNSLGLLLLAGLLALMGLALVRRD